MNPKLTLIEGKWFSNKSVSTRDLFTPLFAVWGKNPAETCHYEQFTHVAGFRAAVQFAFKNHRPATIYVGAHGGPNFIHGFHGSEISRTVVRNAFAHAKTGTKRGVFFGSCEFVTEKNAQLLLAGCPRIAWLAGYEAQINWTDSSVLDLYFFRHYLFPTPGRGNGRPHTPTERLEHAVRKVASDMGPLASRLKFKVYVRRRGGGIEDLVDRETA